MSELSQPIPLENDVIENESQLEFTLNQNIKALVNLKNDNISQYTREVTDITSALINLKWKNRREIYPLRFKEEVYGAVLSEIISSHPHLTRMILSRLEENYQQHRANEADTLSVTRELLEGTYQTPNL